MEYEEHTTRLPLIDVKEILFLDMVIERLNIYYENGKVYKETSLKNGKQDGVKKVYYKNGVLKFEGFYKDEKANGSFKAYYENGQIRLESFYNNGLRTGVFKLIMKKERWNLK